MKWGKILHEINGGTQCDNLEMKQIIILSVILIQDDLVMCKTGDVCKIVGMVDVGHEELVMRTLMSGL